MYEYDPFGQVIRSIGPMAAENPFRFSTKYTDVESGLVYYTFRFYDPGAGRWLSRDPIGEYAGINIHGFVGNNPTSKADVDGRKFVGLQVTDDWQHVEAVHEFPGNSGSRLDWWRPDRFADWFPPGCELGELDDFDDHCLRVMSEEATDQYPWGSLSSQEIAEAINRGYLSEWDAPGTSFSSHSPSEGGIHGMTKGEELEFALVSAASEGVGIYAAVVGILANTSIRVLSVSTKCCVRTTIPGNLTEAVGGAEVRATVTNIF